MQADLQILHAVAAEAPREWIARALSSLGRGFELTVRPSSYPPEGSWAVVLLDDDGRSTPLPPRCVVVVDAFELARARVLLGLGALDVVTRGDEVRLALSIERALHVAHPALEERSSPEGEGVIRALFENSPEGIVVLDGVERRVLFANETFCRFSGLGAAEVVGMRLEQIHPPAKLSRVLAESDRILAGGSPFAESVELPRWDGATWMVDVRATRLEIGARTYLVGLFRDAEGRELAERRGRIERDLIRALAGCSLLDDGLRLCLDAALDVAGVECGGFYLMDDDGGLTLRVHRGLSPEFVQASSRYPSDAPHVAAVRAGTNIFAEYGTFRPRPGSPQEREGLLSVAVLPVAVDGRVLGCLNVASRERRAVSPAARLSLETIAASSAQAIARLRAEEAMTALRAVERDHAARLNFALQAAEMLSWEADVAAGTIAYSSNLPAIAGSELVAPYQSLETFLEHVHEDDRSRVRDAIAATVERGVHYDCDYRVMRPDGAWDWIAGRGGPAFGPDGRVARVIGVALNVTGRRAADEALRASEQRFARLFESAHDGLLVLEPTTGVFTEANPAAVAIYAAQSAAELCSVAPWQLSPPTQPGGRASEEVARERIERTLREGYQEFSWTHRRLDGREFLAEVQLLPVRQGPRTVLFATVRDVTEQRRAQEALAESELRVRTALEALQRREEIFASVVRQATDSIVVFDAATGRFVEFNASAHADLGYTREEFMQLGPRDIQAEHSPRELGQNIERAETKGTTTFLTRHRRKDGSLRDVRVSLAALQIPGVEYLSAVWTDVTELMKAERRRARDAASTAFLLQLHQRAPQLSDAELYDYVLEHAVEVTGSARGFVLRVADDGRAVTHAAWFDPTTSRPIDERAAPLAGLGALAECVREQRPVSIGPTDQRRAMLGVLRSYAALPVIQDGAVRLLFGVGDKPSAYDDEDLTQLRLVANELQKLLEQRAAQELLRRSEAEFRTMFEVSSIGMAQADVSTRRFVRVNRRLCEILGYDAAELTKLDVLGLTHPDDVATSAGILEEVLRGERTAYRVEKRYVRKDGSVAWVDVSVSSVLGADGRLQRVMAAFDDITERKRAEEERVRLEASLRQAQKLEAVGQLAGGVAHDFNNILAAMMMQLDLLRETTNDEEGLSTLDDLSANARRAGELTRQLLLFSRRSVLVVKDLDLNAVVSDLMKMLRRLIREDVTLRFDAAVGLPHVSADLGMLEQVVVNLAVNARDAMPDGGVLTIRTALVDLPVQPDGAQTERRAGRFVCLSVRDTGHGMDDETRRRVFEPFFTTKALGKGTGLGLATAHGIVAQHKGWIEVVSEPGRGSCFEVYLPAIAEGRVAPTGSAVPEAAPERGHETVLVVEDDERVRPLVARTLSRLGYRVLEAHDGASAFAVFDEHDGRIDLLLTDMVLPGGSSGLDIVHRLRARKPGLKVIVSSGYSHELAQIGVGPDAGMVFLPKPYETARLARVVRSTLDT